MLTLLLFLACGSGPAPAPSEEAAPKQRSLTLAAYTTPREAYAEIIPAFQKLWTEKTGEVVHFETSYQGSGAQARAVKEGFEADVVALSLEPDVQVLEDAGLLSGAWRQQAYGGVVTRSLAVIAVRSGNPKHIQDWTDLTRSDVEVLTPNVRSSGGAMWNVMALYGAGLRGHAGVKLGDTAGATELLSKVLARVSVMDKGARESIVNFEKGVGDAAITYENEVIVSKQAGQAMDYVVPPSTILIENPIAVVDSYAKQHQNEDLALAFVQYCLSAEAQRIFANHGLRPSDPSAENPALPQPQDLFTVRDLGGWPTVKADVFGANGVYDKAVLSAGKAP